MRNDAPLEQPRVALLGHLPYTIMVTNAGAGYSRFEELAVPAAVVPLFVAAGAAAAAAIMSQTAANTVRGCPGLGRSRGQGS